MDAPETNSSKGSLLSIFLAAGLAAVVFVALFFLTLGAAGPIVVIIGAVFLVAAFHYFVWGWWLGGMIRREVEEDQRRDP